MQPSPPHRPAFDRGLRNGLRAVALVEAAKGALVLLVGFGLLRLVHRDVAALALRVVDRLHLNPAHRFRGIFLNAASKVTDSELWLLAALALAYSTLRLAEAYGLWRQRPWAEWLALASGAIYLPVEIYELWRHATWLKAVTLAVNVIIIAWMALAIWRRWRSTPAT